MIRRFASTLQFKTQAAGWWRGMAIVLVISLTGCASVQEGLGYYWQSIHGHLSMMHAARPVDELLKDAQLSANLRERLQVAQQIRRYASENLGLPDNGSYKAFADLKRSAVVWNVFATEELSLKMHAWCFPVAGCVNYRGYFDENAARAYAAGLKEKGLDVQVAPVPAYSTLGWFDDPLLNTFIFYPHGELARLVFHELAHQVVYVQGDSAFNESFATAVERIGVDRWLAVQPDRRWIDQYQAHQQRKRAFLTLLRNTKAALEGIYASDVSDAEKRSAKARAFETLKADYAALKTSWQGWSGYDRWFKEPLTNAHFASLGLYDQWVPAFLELFVRQNRDLNAFYAEVKKIAALSKEDRRANLEALLADAKTKPGRDAADHE